ncbi:MAG: YbjN domain-containing protein [Kiritimatiellae bacterium]|nr:YbjN domain-containing protein [Kiritimatiellia bacterium]
MDTEAMLNAIRDYLDDNDWNYEYDAEHSLIKMGLGMKCKLHTVRIFIDLKADYYLVYVVAPINADKDNLGELLRYTARANYGLINGNFELDVRDGEFRYKSYVNCDGLETLPPAIIEESIHVGCAMMNRYGNGFAALAMGFSDADTEIDKVENKDGQDESE